MATESILKMKEVTAASAITTDNTPGNLHYVLLSGTASGDKIRIKDGTTFKLSMIVPTSPGSVAYDPPSPHLFKTDIDCAATAAGSIYATFHYTEIT